MSGTPLQDIITGINEFRRVKTMASDAVEQQTLDGLSYDWWWRERALASGTRVFARFTVPAGYYMALDNRIFFANAAEAYYRVYRPADVDTTGLVVGADLPAKSNLRTDAPIAFTGFASKVTIPTPPNIDNAFVEIPIFSTQGQGNTNAGELDAENAFRLLSPGAVFYLELANSSSNQSSYVKVRLIFSFIAAAKVQPLP